MKRPVGIKSAVLLEENQWNYVGDKNKNIITPTLPQELQRHRKMMSEAAVLSYLVLDRVFLLNEWTDKEEYAYYLGVGASGSTKEELNRILSASVVGDEFSMKRFGEEGLAACNPLFAFQLMNNFTLCHGAILKKVRGPNGAFYSRGQGTVAALQETFMSIAENEVNRGFAGAADTSAHPVTMGELRRYSADIIKSGEGAGLLSLSADLSECFATLREVRYWGGHQSPATTGVEHIVSVKNSSQEWLALHPVRGWVQALQIMQEKNLSSVAVYSEGLDGGSGWVIFDQCAQKK